MEVENRRRSTLKKPDMPAQGQPAADLSQIKITEADEHRGILRLDVWVAKRAKTERLAEPPETIHDFQDLLRLNDWPAIAIESDGFTGLSDSIQQLRNTALPDEPILTDARFAAVTREVEAGLDHFVQPLHDLADKCRSREKRIKEILDSFALTEKAKNIPYAGGTHSPIYQNEHILTPLLEHYPEKVAQMRQAKRDYMDNVQAFDNIAIMTADEEPTQLLAATPSEVMETFHLGDQIPNSLPSPADYERPVKSDMIKKMAKRTFEGTLVAGTETNEPRLPYNLSAKPILRKVLALQIFQVPPFPIEAWTAAFQSRYAQRVLICSWWWIFISNFRPVLDKKESKLLLLLRKLAKAHRELFERIPRGMRDRIAQVFPDCMGQAIFMAFNELFPFKRQIFARGKFLMDNEQQLYKWFLGDLAGGSEHYSFRWREWRFEYVDLNLVPDETCFVSMFDYKLKSEPVPRSCRINTTEKVVLDALKFKKVLDETVGSKKGGSGEGTALKRPSGAAEHDSDEEVFELHPKPRLNLSQPLIVGRRLKFETTVMSLKETTTPLRKLEINKTSPTLAATSFGSPMTITYVGKRYDSDITYPRIIEELEERRLDRKNRLVFLHETSNHERSHLQRKFEKMSKAVDILQDNIGQRRIKRSNLRELRFEIVNAHTGLLQLPRSMRVRIQRGELPPILGFAAVKRILTHKVHHQMTRHKFMGPFFDPEKRTKLTGWDRIQKKLSKMEVKEDPARDSLFEATGE